MKNLYAVCLLVQDFEVSLKFYRDTLGLAINSQDGKYADFKLGDTLLAIFQKDQAISMFPESHMNSGGGAVYAYQVEDITQSCEELKKKGIEIFSGPSTMSWGQTVAYFKDPDSNIWEITS